MADADLAAALSREALAPLRRLRSDQADRLAETRLAWLESADDASAAARLCTCTRRRSATACGRWRGFSATPWPIRMRASRCCSPCAPAGYSTRRKATPRRVRPARDGSYSPELLRTRTMTISSL